MTGSFLADLAERTAATYVESLVGLLLLSWADIAELGALSVFEAAAVAAVPAALAVVKGGLATQRGDAGSASMNLPPIRRH